MSCETGQAPLVIDQTNVLVPMLNPEMPEVTLLESLNVPLPAITDQVPIPTIGMLPFNEDTAEQIVESLPAFAGVAKVLIVATTVSVVGAQVPFEMVQTNTFTPTLTPVMDDVGEVGLVIVPLPETIVHNPVPTIGVLPLRVAEDAQMIKSEPALAIVGNASTLIVTVSFEVKHTPLEMVQTN